MKTRNLIALSAFVGLAGLSQVGADQKDEASAVLLGYQEALKARGEVEPAVLDKIESLISEETTDPGALTEVLRQLHPEFAAALSAAADSGSEEGIELLSQARRERQPLPGGGECLLSRADTDEPPAE